MREPKQLPLRGGKMTEYVNDTDLDLWVDEEGSLYVREGLVDFIPYDPPWDLYGDADFRRDVGL